MKRTTFLSWALRSAAFSLLGNMAMPVAEAWAADEVQVLRRAPATTTGMMSFTTFQQEEQAVANSLPCKWISRDGRLGPSYGNVRYDFLCKGGDFATVSLYLDKADTGGGGVAKARLLYRDWPVNSNPNAGEAVVAQQFLQHVAGRFVPASVAGEVMDAFWGMKARTWKMNGVEISFNVDKGPQFNVRRLEVQGTGGTLSPQIVQLYPVATPRDAGLTVPGVAAQPTQVFVGKAMPEAEAPEKALSGVPITTGMPARVPTDAGLTKAMPVPVNTATDIQILTPQPTGVAPVQAPVIPQEPAVVLPVPGGILPTPGASNVRTGGMLVVPGNAPAGEKGTSGEAAPLQDATPAELNTAPAPESKVVPVAPPELSSTLVPSVLDLKTGSTKAPSNFEAYNRAVELTKDVEEKAQITRVEQAKVTASKPVAKVTKPAAATTLVTPSTVIPASLKPLPTPSTGEGLGVSGAGAAATAPAPVAPAPALEDLGQSPNYNGPRSSEPRPLPQLKFVPKAEPLQDPAQVIQFEDEKSKL